MKKLSKILSLFAEAIAYGFLSSVFVLIVVLIENFLTRTQCVPDFPCFGYNYERGIPIGTVFISAVLLSVFWNLLFGKIIKSTFIRWFLILITSSITSILLQTAYFISDSHLTINQIISEYLPDNASELFGVKLMIKVFLILTPFTILFANRRSLFEKLKNRNALK